MKNIKLLHKILILIILISILFLNIIPTQLYASSIESVIEGADKFIDDTKKSPAITIGTSSIRSVSNIVYNTLLGVGIIISLAIGSVLGIKFITDSAEDKAKVKEALIPYIIGNIIIFGAFGIWKVTVKIGSNLDNNPNYYVEKGLPDGQEGEVTSHESSSGRTHGGDSGGF